MHFAISLYPFRNKRYGNFHIYLALSRLKTWKIIFWGVFLTFCPLKSNEYFFEI